MNIININNNFNEEVSNFEGKCVVDFFATWCGPCRMFGPIFEEVSNELSNVKFCKVDVDDDNDISKKLGIMSIPTTILFKNGKEIKRNIGLMDKEELINFLND